MAPKGATTSKSKANVLEMVRCGAAEHGRARRRMDHSSPRAWQTTSRAELEAKLGSYQDVSVDKKASHSNVLYGIFVDSDTPLCAKAYPQHGWGLWVRRLERVATSALATDARELDSQCRKDFCDHIFANDKELEASDECVHSFAPGGGHNYGVPAKTIYRIVQHLKTYEKAVQKEVEDTGCSIKSITKRGAEKKRKRKPAGSAAGEPEGIADE
jgi:hypothetical protein